MIKLVRGALIVAVAMMLSACQGNNAPSKVGSRFTMTDDGTWSGSYQPHFDNDEPAQASWDNGFGNDSSGPTKIERIRKAALGVAPAGADIEQLSRVVGKRREAEIDCIPVELTMILNTVGWHYGRHVHIQSGYRSKNHNRSVGGARGSYHLTCQAADIQVDGVDKYQLAKFLKDLPGRGGVGTYCNVSTVHIDVGPKREWHYGCGRRSARRYARARLRR